MPATPAATAAEPHLHIGQLLHFLDDPATHPTTACEYTPDGALLIQNGTIARIGSADQLRRDHPNTPSTNHGDNLIVPGLIDTHIHYPQTDIIAASGQNLLDWLQDHAFPAELAFADPAHCATIANRFLDELLRHGTTTALVFATVHPHSVDALFHAAEQRNLRIASGKTLMDCNAPQGLQDTPETADTDSRALIQKWHQRGRFTYTITPRFAVTSSPAQLAIAGKLLQDHPGTLLHTHLSENNAEIAAVQQQHPGSENYTHAYHRHGLVCDRSIFAHSLHLDDSEWELLARQNASISHCPTSNLMLGSGTFNAARAQKEGIKIGIGTDVGGGSSFSLLRVMDEAHKTARLRGNHTNPETLWYWATLGGARALQMHNHIGNFAEGKEADFITLNPNSTPTLARRYHQVKTIQEKLQLMAILGDDRLIDHVYIMGKQWCATQWCATHTEINDAP